MDILLALRQIFMYNNQFLTWGPIDGDDDDDDDDDDNDDDNDDDDDEDRSL